MMQIFSPAATPIQVEGNIEASLARNRIQTIVCGVVSEVQSSTFTLPGSFAQFVALSSWMLFYRSSTGLQRPNWRDFRRWDRRAWKWPIWVFAPPQGLVSSARLPIPASSSRLHLVGEGWRCRPCHLRKHLDATYPKWRSSLVACLENHEGRPTEPWRNPLQKEFRPAPWSKSPTRIDCCHPPSPQTLNQLGSCTNLFFVAFNGNNRGKKITR